MSNKPCLMGDITERTILVFVHPKSPKDDPELCAIHLLDYMELGPPTTKKGRPWIFVSTQIIH